MTPILIWGWKAICQYMGISERSINTAKRILNKHKLLHYEGGRPYIVLSEMEAHYGRKKETTVSA